LNTAYTLTYTAYRQTDSLIRATGASGALQTQRDSLRIAMRTYRMGLNQLHQLIDSVRSLRLDSIEQINNQLQNGTVQSLNEQTLNQLRIRLNNKKAFTQAEQTLLYFIAMQCPYSGGAPVYTARALYALVNDTLDFMDHVLCGNEDWFFRKEEIGANASTSIILYPNPAHHIINIAGLVADEENKVEIFNNMGIRISEAICTLSNLALDVSNYPNGVYIIKVSNSSLTESFKITINR
ncbi:MAG: T9SS type A sorting domain-containing protein, partial [Bacteroidota bacterium]